MRILYLSQYFPPEVGATQTRAYEMARGLVQAGHQVTMLTEVPNHPAGVIRPDYRRRLWVRRQLEGIDVLHGWVWTSPHKNFVNRMAFYLSYMAGATMMGWVLARGRYDAIYCTSPPLFAGGAALALHFLRRTPLFFEIRDLWPESAVEMGELNNRRAIQVSAWLADQCYRHSHHLVVVTEGIRNSLLQKGIPADKITLIPNGANTELFQPQPEVLDSLVVDLEYLGRESYMPLFVVLREGQVLDEPLTASLRQAIREALSPRHVPSEILAVPAVPRTLSGKKMELPVKKLLLGAPVDSVLKRDAMANADCLDWFVALAAARPAAQPAR